MNIFIYIYWSLQTNAGIQKLLNKNKIVLIILIKLSVIFVLIQYYIYITLIYINIIFN